MQERVSEEKKELPSSKISTGQLWSALINLAQQIIMASAAAPAAAAATTTTSSACLPACETVPKLRWR